MGTDRTLFRPALNRLHGARRVARQRATLRVVRRGSASTSRAGCPPSCRGPHCVRCGVLSAAPRMSCVARRRLPAIRLRRRPRSACTLAALSPARSQPGTRPHPRRDSATSAPGRGPHPSRDVAHIRAGTRPTSTCPLQRRSGGPRALPPQPADGPRTHGTCDTAQRGDRRLRTAGGVVGRRADVGGNVSTESTRVDTQNTSCERSQHTQAGLWTGGSRERECERKRGLDRAAH